MAAMFDFLYSIPDTIVFIIFGLMLILFSISAIWFIGRVIPLHVRFQDNAVIGSVSQLIGVIYGVLASLMALYLLNNISYTADAVQREANSIADIYRDSRWLGDPARSQLQSLVKAYLAQTINVEWPLMEIGKPVTDEGEILIDKISNVVRGYQIANNSELLICTNLLEAIKSLNNAREQRIHMSNMELNGEIWAVILIGTFLVLAINFLFAMNFTLHVLVVSGTSLMASSMIFLLVTLDRPFQGEFVVQPDAFVNILNFIEKHPNNPSATMQSSLARNESR